MSMAILLKGSSMMGRGMSGALAGLLAVDFWHLSHAWQWLWTSRYRIVAELCQPSSSSQDGLLEGYHALSAAPLRDIALAG